MRIKREGYTRKAFDYVRNGKKIHVPRTRVKKTVYTRPGKRTSHKPAWIQVKGGLGGPGYTIKSQKDRHKILRRCVAKDGYRVCLMRVEVLRRPKNVSAQKKQLLAKDRRWLVQNYGGKGSKRKPKRGPRSKRK